jgi:hypothetical protein
VLFHGLLRTQAQALLRRQEWLQVREEERRPDRSEDWHQLQVSSRLDERWPQREQRIRLLRGPERLQFPALLRLQVRVQEQGLHQGLLLPQPSGGWSLQADEVRSQMAEDRNQKCRSDGMRKT